MHTVLNQSYALSPGQFTRMDRPSYLIQTFDPIDSLAEYLKAPVTLGKKEFLTGLIKGGLDGNNGNGYLARVLVPVNGLDIWQLPVVTWTSFDGYTDKNRAYYYDHLADAGQKAFYEAAFTVCPLAKDSSGVLHIGMVRRLDGMKATLAYLNTIFSWAPHKNLRVSVNQYVPEPMPDSLTPTARPRGGKKGASWLLRPPAKLLNLA